MNENLNLNWELIIAYAGVIVLGSSVIIKAGSFVAKYTKTTKDDTFFNKGIKIVSWFLDKLSLNTDKSKSELESLKVEYAKLKKLKAQKKNVK